MRILGTLLITLAMVLPSLAATTWPAGTNINNTFFGTNTFRTNTIVESTLQFTKMPRPGPSPTTNDIFMWLEDMNGLPAIRVQDSTGLILGMVRDDVWIAQCAIPGGIKKGEAVYVAGIASTNAVWVGKAQANDAATMACVGLAAENIAYSKYGRIMNNGLLVGINTTNWASGETLYVSDTVAGGLTNVLPLVPNFMQQVGMVQINDATNGSIQIQLGSLLNEANGTSQTNWYFGPYGTNILSPFGSKINGVGFTNGVVYGDGSGLTGVGVPNALTNLDTRAWTNSAGDTYLGQTPNLGSLFLWSDGDAAYREVTTAAGGFVNVTPSLSVGTNVVSRNGIFYGDGSGLTNLLATNYLPLIGGTVSGAVLSTSATTNSPSQTELATAGWVRSLFNNGVLDYVTTNIDTAATNAGTAGQPVYQFETTIPATTSRSYVNPAAGTYVGSVMTTNTFQFVQGPIEVNSYFHFASGGGNAITLHPEIYYSYDKTNWQGDYAAAGQALIAATTNLYQFVISFPAITSTNPSGFYLQRRYKIDSKGGSPTLTVLIGTNVASGTLNAAHIAFSGPNSGNGNAYLANNQTFTGTNTFTAPTIFSELDVGTLVVTNPPVLNLSASTNYYGTNLNNGGGTAGQLLTATASGVAWSNAPAAGNGSSNITDNAYVATIRNATVSTNLIAQGAVTITTNSVNATTAAALVVTNESQATGSGAMQNSPAVLFAGNGWKTDATPGSQPVAMGFQIVPQSGSANPSARLYVNKSINGETPVAAGQYFTSGGNFLALDVTASGNLFGSAVGISARSIVTSPNDGVVVIGKGQLSSPSQSFLALVLGAGTSTASTAWMTTNWPSLYVDSSTNDVTLSVRKGTNDLVGTFSSLAAASLILRTNYSANEFSISSSNSLAGTSRLVVSNNVLYFVTATKTNLIIDGN